MSERTFTVPSGAEVEIDVHGYITTDVVLNVSALIDHDFEQFLDLLSLGATDTELLMDIAYEPTSLTAEGCLVFSVTGDVSMVLECEADDGGS